MKIVVTILLGMAVAQASALSEQEHFEKFKTDYERKYECPELEKLRLTIFKKTLKLVEENQKLYKEGKITYELGINDFADLLISEVPTGAILPGEKIRESPTQEFEKFKADFNKQYECPELEAVRFKIFEDSLKKIEEHNEDYEQGITTFKLGITQFTDVLPEEVPKGRIPSKGH